MVDRLTFGVRGLLGGIALLTALHLSCALGAQERAEPVAVLCVSSIDHLMEDVAYLTRAADRLDVGAAMQLMNASLLQHFDRQRPAGVLITLANGEPKGVGFLPVPDGAKFLQVFRDKWGADVDNLGSGISKLDLGKGAYFKQRGQWLYFTDDHRHLAELPEDPAAMLDGLDQQYGIALRFYPSNIPQRFRDVADFWVHTKIDANLRDSRLQHPELDVAVVDSVGKSLKQWSSSLINQTDQITIGWAVDTAERRTYLDVRGQAQRDSALARQFTSLMQNQSTFTGFFVEDAAAAFQGSLRVTDQGKDQIGYFLQYARKQAKQGIEADPRAPEALHEIVDSVLDVVDRTVREGKTDVGATLVLAPKTFKFVGGLRVADGRALAEAFEKLFELAKHEQDLPEVHFYAGKHRDLDLHTLSLPVAEKDREARKLMGENVDITIATGPEQLYFALGPGAGELLKSIVDRSATIGSQQVPPVHLRVAVKPVIQFLASMDAENKKAERLQEVIEAAQGGDSIELSVQQVENGIGLRLELAEGVLKLLGAASQQQGAE